MPAASALAQRALASAGVSVSFFLPLKELWTLFQSAAAEWHDSQETPAITSRLPCAIRTVK